MSEPKAYSINDWINGTTVDVVRITLNWFITIKLGLQLRHFVKALTSVEMPIAGSLAAGQCNLAREVISKRELHSRQGEKCVQ